MDFLRAGIKSVVGSQESQTNQANGIETVRIIVLAFCWKMMGLKDYLLFCNQIEQTKVE